MLTILHKNAELVKAFFENSDFLGKNRRKRPHIPIFFQI
jgi:hypothetical protein